MSPNKSPLSGPPPPEVPLPRAPLVRVIAQVRFPMIASVDRREFIAPFQEAVRDAYPVLRPEQSQSVTFGVAGVIDTRSSSIWRLFDAGAAWRVTLAPDFLALETTAYSSRADFLDRLRRLLQALEVHVDPKVIDRLGVRYIDRITGDNLAELPKLVRPEVGGILTSALRGETVQALSESVFTLPEEGGALTARWGLVPAQRTVDPSSVEAIDSPSWILDLDAFQEFSPGPLEFNLDDLISRAGALSERIYSLFRWAVTDEFLRRHGGNP